MSVGKTFFLWRICVLHINNSLLAFSGEISSEHTYEGVHFSNRHNSVYHSFWLQSQYEFLHELAIAYTESNEHYANK